jgi:SAM-dependent methyltransferase
LPKEGRIAQSLRAEWTREQLLAQLYDWEHDEFEDDQVLYGRLAAESPGPILEICCGSGRVLDPFVAVGLTVFGVDRSPAMLARAARRLGTRPGVHLLQADVATDELPGQGFDLVVAALNALGYVRTIDQQIELLHQVGRRLTPNGRAVIDLVNIGAAVDQPQGLPVLQKSGPDEEIGAHVTKWMVQGIRWATQELVLASFYDVTWDDGVLTRLTEEATLRFYTRFEIDLLLDRAGLEVEEFAGDYDGSAFVDGSPRLIVVARRG